MNVEISGGGRLHMLWTVTVFLFYICPIVPAVILFARCRLGFVSRSGYSPTGHILLRLRHRYTITERSRRM